MPRLKIGLTLILLIAGLFLSGNNPWFIAGVLLALAIHEISHILTSNLLGYQVYELKLNIFGGCLTIDPLFGTNPNMEIVIAAAGPAVNFLMALGVIYLNFLGFHHDYLEYWRQINVGFALANLIPAYPLDGGRIMHAWLCKATNLKTAARISRGLTMVVALFLITSGILRLFFKTGGFTFLLVGIFILAQYWYCKTPEINFLKILRQKQKSLEQNGLISAKLIRVLPKTPLRFLLQHSAPGEYLLFFIEDDRKNFQFISEEQAWRILGEEGYQATFNPAQAPTND